MTFSETSLPGVVLIEPRVFADSRGFFLETYRSEVFAEAGIGGSFVQDNHSRSARGVLRGLHYQVGREQGKLVRVVRGEVFDVAVDLRRGSPHFGRWFGARLSDGNHRMVYIPPGFAHGFCTLSEEADFVYKCTERYDPAGERGVRWDDPDLGIAWPLEAPLLSDKDRRLPLLREMPAEDLPVFAAAGGEGAGR